MKVQLAIKIKVLWYGKPVQIKLNIFIIDLQYDLNSNFYINTLVFDYRFMWKP